MPLNLSQLTEQLQQMGAQLAEEERKRQSLLSKAMPLLGKYSDSYESLGERARSAEQNHWHGAIPLEPLLTDHPLPPHPQQATLIAADGSQIEPDRHGAALYAAVNVGSIVLEYGTANRPVTQNDSHLYCKDEDLYEEKRLVQGNLLDIRRDTAELQKLAELAKTARYTPVIAFSDGTLLLWILEESPASRKQERLMRYLHSLNELQAARAAIAAFTSRPRHAEVASLLHLASLKEDYTPQELGNNPLEKLQDRALFHQFLPPGHRSALFISATPINAEYCQYKPDQEICFFYMNIGDNQRTVIARIEVPHWVATTSAPYQPGPPWEGQYNLIDLAQTAIYEQCHVLCNYPYPYALARAHELALVSFEEQRALERSVIVAIAQQGILVQPSEKAQLKELTGSSKRRHRL